MNKVVWCSAVRTQYTRATLQITRAPLPYIHTRRSINLCASDDYSKICLWHSWTKRLRTESFLKPFGLQDLRIFIRPKFLWGAMKNSVYSNNPHTIDELKMAVTECIRNVDRATLNTVFEIAVHCVSSVLENGGGHLEHYCNFLYCNHQVHREFLVTLYKCLTFKCYKTTWRKPVQFLCTNLYKTIFTLNL